MIAGELAKRSPSETGLTVVEDCSEPLFAITNGESCHDFPNMVWAGNQDHQGANNTENESPTLQNTSRDDFGDGNRTDGASGNLTW